MCVIFLVNLDNFFAIVCTDFHESLISTGYIPKEQKATRENLTTNFFSETKRRSTRRNADTQANGFCMALRVRDVSTHATGPV